MGTGRSDLADGDAAILPPFLAGGGACGALIAGRDWSGTPLGPIGGWPASLRTVAALLLRSPVPMVLLWGESGVMLYNDAYSVFAGGRHPDLLGSDVREGWPEVAAFNDNVMRVVLAGGTLQYRDQELTLFRNGAAERVRMDLDYSPAPGDDGRPAGVLAIVVETTERARAERAQAESEARFRNMADHAPVMMWVTDADGACTYLNRAWYAFTGQTEAEAEGFGWLEATHPDDKEEAGRVFLQANAARAPFRLDYRLRRADGTYRWAIDAASPRFGADGAFLGHVGSVIDIDERVEAERAVRDSEAELRLITDALPVLVAYVDRDLVYRFVNRAYEEWFGVPRDRIVGRRLHDLLGAERVDALRGCVERVLGGERAGYSHRGAYGVVGERAIEADYLPRFAADGSVQGFYVLIADVTERRAAEERAQAEAAERDAILSQLAEGVIVTDGEGRIAFVNGAAERLHGVRLLGVAPEGYAETYHLLTEGGEPYPPRDLPLARAVLDGETVADARWRIRRPDGSEVVAIGSAQPITGPDGARRGAVLTLRDDTARAEAQAALAAKAAEFEALAENVSQLAWMAEPDGHIFWYNKRWYDYTGARPDAMRGWGWRAVHDPATLPEVERRWGASIATGEPFEMIFPLRGADGAFRPFLTRAEPIRDADGRLLRWFGTNTDISAQRRAEEALRFSEARLRAVLDSVSDGFYAIDGECRLTVCNRAAADYLRIDAQAAIGRSIIELAGLEDTPERRRAFAARLEQAGGDGVELVSAIRPDRFVELRAAPLPDGGWAVSFTDVTERRRAQEALRQSEARLRAIVDAAPVGLVFADADGRITGGNAFVETLIGHPVLPSADVDAYGEWVGFHPDGRQVQGREYPLARALAGEERPELEVRYRRGDGSLHWMRFVAAAKRDGEGRITGAVVASLDIDKERRAEEELRRINAELEARVAAALAERRVFADIVEGTEAVVQVVDRDLRLLAVNKAAAAASRALFGYALGPGDHVLDGLDGLPGERAKAERLWTRALGGESFTEVVEVGPAGGERRWYELAFSPLRDPAGAIIGAFQFANDVSARVRDQERLAQAEEALRQAQKMEAVGQLTGGIAHDFNNLLGAVVGSLDLIRRRPEDLDRVRRYAEAGLQAAERGAKLTGQLLAFSRAQRIELKPLDPSELVEGMGDMLGRTLGPMVRLRFDLGAEGAAVLSDATQLEMAVLNLAINARDAMADGGELRIATALRRVEDDPELAPGDYVEIAVSDTGSGMPPEVVARAFDPFFTTKGVGKGTGLGLSQVYGVARQTGGAVRIDSRVGGGTTVRVLLPRTDMAVRAGVEAAGSGDGRSAAAARVLVVDDDPDMRRMLVESLDALGYRVTEAADGPAALSLLEAARPDLLMVDFAMPGMNGAEVARAARARRPDLPVVFASGYSDTAAIEEAAGPNAPLLRKPFRIADLQALLEEVLARG